MESQLTLITLTLVIATIFGVALSRFRISPIPAYLIAGLLGKSFGLDYSSDLFNFLSTLAINLVSFNVGISLDIRELKNILSKATIIAITEYIVGFTIISIISLIIGLPFYDTFILTIISVTTSTTITYKLIQNKIDDKQSGLILAVLSLEDVITFIALGVILSSNSNIVEIIPTSLASLGLGYLVSRTIINRSINTSEESVIISSIASVLSFSLLGQIFDIPSTLANFLLGLGASYALKDTKKVSRILSPLIDFSLIFFFFSAGSYLNLSLSSLYVLVPISLIMTLVKYLSFSTSYWLTGSNFLVAFRSGIYMTSLSELGIIVALNAFQQGIITSLVYNLSAFLVMMSSTITSITVPRERRIIGLISKTYEKLRIDRIDGALQRITRVVKLNRNTTSNFILRFILIGLITIFSASYLLIFLVSFARFFIYIAPLISVLVPFLLALLVIEETRRLSNLGQKRINEIILWIIYVFITINFEIFIVRIISELNYYVIYLGILVSIIVIVIMYQRLNTFIKELDKSL